MIKKLLSRADIKARLSIFLLGLFSYLSLKNAHRIGHCLSWLALRLPSSLLRVTQKNIDLCFPDKTASQRRALVEQSIRHTACLMLEFGLVWFRSIKTNRAQIVGVKNKHLLDSAVQEGKGVIVLAPHLGNWEWLNSYTTSFYPGITVYKQPKDPLYDQLLIRSREVNGGQLAPATTAGVKSIYRHLKQGGIVYILPDQVPGTEGGLIAPFFGQPALTMTLVSKLLAKTGARAVAIYGQRLEHAQGFDVIFKEVDARIYSHDLLESVSGLNATVEACVRDIPEQYQWSYKRFKRTSEAAQTLYAPTK